MANSTATANTAAAAAAAAASSQSSSNNNPREIFDTTGDALAALQVLEDNHRRHHQQTGHGGWTLTERYNRIWLAGLARQKLGASTAAAAAATATRERDDDTFIRRLGIAQEAIIDAQPALGGVKETERNQQEQQQKQEQQQQEHNKPTNPFDVQRETWTLTFNQALMFISHGNYDLAQTSVVEELRPLLEARTNAKRANSERGRQALKDMELPPVNAKLGVWMSFALLESTLTKYPFQITRKDNNNSNNNNNRNGDGQMVDLNFLRALTDFIRDNVERKDVGGDDPQLKFLWSLYKSRLDFFERDEDGKLVDSSVRSARKELKAAMEIFQQKLLRGGTGGGTNESGSLASSSSAGAGTGGGTTGATTVAGSTNNANTGSTNNHYVQPAMSRDLQAMNRAALNLKANTELLKGNVKKSLILCSEALGSVSTDSGESNKGSSSPSTDDNDCKTKAYYDAIHQNNLALVYEASGKSYLALHALSKAITSVGASGSLLDRFEKADKGSISIPNRVSTAPCNFDTDGTARSDVTVPILNNAAICSLRTGNYLAAYECMSKCIQNSEVWKDRTRSWIHLAEACIGMHTQQKQEQKADSVPIFSAASSSSVTMGGKPRGLLVGTSSTQNDTTSQRADEEMVWTDFTENDLPKLGTGADLEFIKKFPIVRAKSCLQTALKYFDRMWMSPRDIVAHQSARCSMAYVCMEMKEYATAQKYCEQLILAGYDLVSSHGPSSDAGVGGGDMKENNDTSKLDDAQLTLIRRLMATARLYASEACSILGDSMSSMTFILGDKKENALDRLAIDLSGVTIEKANSSPKAKTQLAKAQCMVRCNASAAWAVIGNHPVSRQLAMSAQAMENSYSMTRDDSAARKAVIYGMLREGNQGAALLTLLRSSASSSIR